MPAGSDPARHDVVPLDELARTSLIGFWSCRSFDELRAELERRGIELTPAFTTSDDGTARGLVEAGLGYALVQRLCVDPGATAQSFCAELESALNARRPGRSPAFDARTVRSAIC